MTAVRGRGRFILSSLAQLIDGAPTVEKPNITATIRMLGANKELRLFCVGLCKYSKADWARFIRMCKIIYGILQSSLLIKQDSQFADEIAKIPHFAMLFRRINEDD